MSTDRTWLEQLKDACVAKHVPQHYDDLLEGLVCWSAIESICNTIIACRSEVCPEHMISLSVEDEEIIASRLAKLVNAKRVYPGLTGLIDSMGLLRSEFYRTKLQSVEEIPWFGLKLFPTFQDALKIVKNHSSCETQTWALLFDELELAPDHLQTLLWRQIRGGPSDILLKITASPLGVPADLDPARWPTPVQDYERIELWPNRKDESRFLNFAIPLLAREIVRESQRVRGAEVEWSSESGVEILTKLFPTEVPSAFKPLVSSPRQRRVTVSSSIANHYSPNGYWYDQFRILYLHDARFRVYLDRLLLRYGLTIEQMDKLPDNIRAVLRKVQALVQLRNYLIRYSGTKRARVRSLISKNSPMYPGNALESLQLLEFNPRMVVFFGRQTAHLNSIRSEHSRKASIVSALTDLAEIHLSQLRSREFTVSDVEGEQFHSIGDFVIRIGKALYDRFYNAPFNPDPILAFDCKRADPIAPLLLKAAFGGGLVLEKEKIVNVVRGHSSADTLTFRLSRLLAYSFYLPAIRGRSVSIHNLLGSELPGGSLKLANEIVDSQGSLGL